MVRRSGSKNAVISRDVPDIGTRSFSHAHVAVKGNGM